MKLTPPIRSDEKSMLVYDKAQLIATFYHGHEIKNEVIRRVNAYDKLKQRLKELEDLSNNHGNAVESIIEINKLVKKTLQEI